MACVSLNQSIIDEGGVSVYTCDIGSMNNIVPCILDFNTSVA